MFSYLRRKQQLATTASLYNVCSLLWFEQLHLHRVIYAYYFCTSAWAIKRGFYTTKGARPDVYRAANSILRMAVDGRLSMYMRPPGYYNKQGKECLDACVITFKVILMVLISWK